MSSKENTGRMQAQIPAQTQESQFVKCECCGLTEECTAAYIGRVRERFSGHWICGLCSEAVKDESYRSQKCVGEALDLHMNFCQQFKSSIPPANPTSNLIWAITDLLRRSLDSPRKKKGSVFPSSSSCSSLSSSDF